MSNTQGILTNLGDESLDPTPVHEAFVVCLSGVCQMSDEAPSTRHPRRKHTHV